MSRPDRPPPSRHHHSSTKCTKSPPPPPRPRTALPARPHHHHRPARATAATLDSGLYLLSHQVSAAATGRPSHPVLLFVAAMDNRLPPPPSQLHH